MVFIQVVGGLLQHSSATVRRKAMELLNTKLHQSHISYSEDEVTTKLCLLSTVLTLTLLVAYLAIKYKIMQKNPEKLTEALAHGYSSESTHRELSNEYQHDRV